MILTEIIVLAGACGLAAPLPAPQSVRLEMRDSGYAIIQEHLGPYWTIGPRFAKLRPLAAESDGPVRLFVRFFDHPGQSRAEAMRSVVGLMISSPQVVEPPFKLLELPAEEVACLRPPPSDSPAINYALLSQWAHENGLVAAGPLIEWHELGIRGGDLVEVQLVVARPPTDPVQPTVDELAQTDALPAGEQPLGTDVRPEQHAELHVEAPEVGEAMVEEPSGGDSDPAEFQSALPPAEDPNDPSISAVTQSRDDSSTTTVHELMQSGRVDQIADQIVVRYLNESPTVQAWLGQVIARINAAAQGMEKRYPEESAGWLPLAEALSTRWRDAVHPTAAIPGLPAAQEDLAAAATRRQLLRELDVLLVRIGQRAWDAPRCMDELVRILEAIP